MKRAAICTAVLVIAVAGVAQGQSAAKSPRTTSGASAQETRQNSETRLVLSPIAEKHEAQPLRFRRVYVPESELLKRVKRDERYVPMSAADFEARLQRSSGGFEQARTPEAGITYASYSARLDRDFRLTGTGAWNIKLAGKEPALLPLTELGLALRRPRWAPVEGSSTFTPAKLGATESDIALYADRSGAVVFDWSLAGSQDSQRRWTYVLAFPPCGSQRIELTLPANLTPTLEGAIISAAQSIGDESRRWLIDVIGQAGGILRLSENVEQDHARPAALMRPRVTYELSQRGLQLSAEWQIDVLGEPLGKIDIDVDTQLTVLSASSGGTALTWSEPADSAEDGARRIVLSFPEPLQGTNRLVRLTAVAPLRAGIAWKLPNFRARDLVWQDGTMALVVARPLVLERLDLANCRQDKRESLPAPTAGEAIGIQAFGPSASATVYVATQKERLELRCGTTFELSGNEAIASYVAEIAASQGERFQLTASISPDWIVDSVQSSPAEMIADWDRQRGDGANTRLVIQLAESINRDRPIRLNINATRRRAVLGDRLNSEDLRLLTFDDLAPVRRLVHLRSAPSYRLVMSGDEDLTRLDPASLEPSDRSLFGETLDGQVFLKDKLTGDVQISVLPQRPQFSASLQTRVVVGERYLDEAYEILINPESNELGQVVVHFSQARAEEISWVIGDSGEAAAARRLSRDEQTALAIGERGETWEVRIPAARTDPFVLTASRRSPAQGAVPIALPSLLHTPSQQGNVRVEMASEFVPTLIERRLKSLAIEPAPSGTYQNVIAAYEYDPAEDLLIVKEPALELVVEAEPERRRPAWVWRCALAAWLAPSGNVQYQARFHVENSGRSQITIALRPDELSPDALPTVKIDGTTTNIMSWDQTTGALVVTLPVGRRYVLVDAAWSESRSALGGISRRSLWWPTADVPILSRDGAVWLQKGYVRANTQDTAAAADSQPIAWRQRLFGPLGRPYDRETFEPWLANEWLRLSRDPTSDAIALRRAGKPDGPLSSINSGAADSASSVWPAAAQGVADDMPHDGWTAYHLEATSNEDHVNLLIVRRQMLVALGVGLFLLSVAVFWKLSRQSAALQIVTLGIVVIVALLLPPVFAPLGAASVLGFLGGKLCRWLFPPAIARNREELAAQPIVATVSSLFVVAWLSTSAVVAQAPPPVDTQTAPAAIFDVLIPIDDDGKVAGEKVFVPEALYGELIARSSDKDKKHHYLITSASYEGAGQATLPGAASSGPLSWKAELTIAVLEPSARVLLPLGKSVQIVPDSGRLNGQALQFGWDEAQQWFYFDVNESGVADVTFEFRQVGSDDAQGRAVSIPIPRVPQSSLRLFLADTAKPPRVQALGGAGTQAGSKHLIAELGPIGQINLEWSAAPSHSDSPSQFDCDESTWLRLRPGSALLNARFAIQVRRGEVAELSLELDNRLSSLPIANQSLIESIERVSETEAKLRFTQPIRDRAVIDLAFVVQGMSGAGRYPWPHVGVAGMAANRRRIACTVDQSLELASFPAAGVKPLNSAAFAAIWGEPDARPLAFELTTPRVDWLLDLRPRQATLTSSYRTIVELNPSEAELRWDVAIEISGGSRYQLRAAVPPELAIEHVEVRDEAGVRPCRWTLADSRTLTVFFDAVAAGKLQLTTRGRVPVNEGSLTVPMLNVEGSTQRQASLVVLRRSNVVAKFERHGALRELAPAEAEALLNHVDFSSLAENAASRRGHLVAAFDVKSARGPVILAVQKNAPKVEAIQAMSLLRQTDTWQAALDLQLSISEGVLDTVRIDAPASWTAPFKIEPAVPHRVIDVPGENRRQLVLLPPHPLAGETQFHIEGRLTPNAGPRVRAPDARVVGAASLVQYFALPLQQDLQSLAWETRGLKPAPLPGGLLHTPIKRETVQTFLRAAEQFRAELRSVEKIADDVQVRLADFSVSFSRGGACYTAASFDIEPAGRTSCRLALPDGSRLVHVSVDGSPLRLAPAGDQRWQIPLSGGRLPQRIELVYTGQLIGAVTRSRILEGPKLIGVPIERTLWTVAAPPRAGGAIADDVEPLTPLQHEATRYESTAGLIESAAATLAEVASQETPRWYTAWAQRMMAARESLARQESLPEEAALDPDLTARMDLVDQDQDRLAERLGTYDLLDELWNEPPHGQSPVAVWNASLNRRQETWQGMLLGEASSIELSFPDYAGGDYSAQIVSALVAAALLLIAVAITRYTRVLDWFSRRPRFVFAVFGLFWWLFLWPSAAGWAIVLAAVLLPHVKRFARRGVDSTSRSARVA